MKIFKNIFAVVLIVCVGLILVKDMIIKATVTSVASNILGAQLKIDKFSLGLLSQRVKIQNTLLYNPAGFSNEPFVNIPEIDVHYDGLAILQGKLHFPSIIFNLKEVVLIKNQKGELNVNALKIVAEQKKGKEEAKDAAKSQEPQTKKSIDLQIDEITLNVERVVSKDYTQGDPPLITVLETPIRNKTFPNITSPEQLTVLILTQALGPSLLEGTKIYAAAAILGVGFLPAGVAGVLLGNDDATQDFTEDINKVYSAMLSVIQQQNGKLKSENKDRGIIKAQISGYDVAIKIEPGINRHVKVGISARKLLLPKADFARGLLYQLSEQLKK